MEEERQARLQMGNAGVFPGGLMERKGGAVERSLHSVHLRRWEKRSILFTVKKAAVDKKTWVVHQKQRKITGLISPEHAREDGAWRCTTSMDRKQMWWELTGACCFYIWDEVGNQIIRWKKKRVLLRVAAWVDMEPLKEVCPESQKNSADTETLPNAKHARS